MMNETDALATVLSQFDVLAIGGGDPIVGTNVLACMACTLANLVQDNEVVRMADESPARLGTSLLIAGSATAGKVVDEIIAEITRRQNNFSSNLQAYSDWVDEAKDKPMASTRLPKSKFGEAAELVYFTQSEYGELHADNIAAWRNVIERRPSQTITEIIKRRKFMVSVGGRKELESQLADLQPGNPLLHLGLTKPTDLSKYADAGTALLEGRYELDDGSRTVKGNFLITDPLQVLKTAAGNCDERTAWLSQMLWLCDNDDGPMAPPLKARAESSVHRTGEVFRCRLTEMIAHRLNLPNQTPWVIPEIVQPALVRWSEFLRDMEPHNPGISGAARNFFTSLAFGLMALKKKGDIVKVAGVEALARFLVRRMANLRLSITHAGEIERKRDLIRRIFHKLGEGPMSGRKFSQNLKLNAADRDEALRWMQAANLVTQGQEGWYLCDGAQLNFNGCNVPIIEV